MKNPLEKLSLQELEQLLNKEYIDKINKLSNELAASKSEDELFEMIGKSVSFENQFKPGDMICSDRFYNGKVMVVIEGSLSYYGSFGYKCEDLVVEKQTWAAREYDANIVRPSMNWRLATDEDIVAYLTRFINSSEQTIGCDCTIQVIEDGLNVYGPGEDFLHFDKKEARALKDYLNKWIIE